MAVTQDHKVELTLGPVPFNWTPTIWRDFYYRIADEAAIDIVYLGEVVCSKRSIFFERLYPSVVARLAAAEKRVVLSTLATVFLPGDRRAVSDVCGNSDFLVEANDGAALFHLRGRPHHVGPFVNVYNEKTLDALARLGAESFCLPAEVPADVVHRLRVAATASAAHIEVQVFGRMPLALSARCYHARAHGRTRDGCQFVCDQDPDGLAIDTLDGRPFLVINGIQVLSFTWLNLIGSVEALTRAGVTRLRLSPHSCDMTRVARIFRLVVDGEMTGDEGTAQLQAAAPMATFANGFYTGQPGYSWTPPQASVVPVQDRRG